MQLVERRQHLRDEHAAITDKALTLRRITRSIAANESLHHLLQRHIVDNTPRPPSDDESAFLAAGDIASGRRFDVALIPTIALADDTSKSTSLPTQQSDTIPDASDLLADDDDDDDVAITIEPISTEEANEARSRTARRSTRHADADDSAPVTYAQKASEEPDGPVALPAQVAPPLPEDEAEFSAETQELVDSESPQRPAKVVHLPPEEVKGTRRRQHDEDRAKTNDAGDQTKSSKTNQTEPASSPSSTVGPYSAATPMPQQDSPDTSPDSENAEQIQVLPPKDMRPSSEERREKEQHDRLLAAQKDLARRQALGDVSTADDQLIWEGRTAAAREAEESAARQEVNGPEADAKNESEETQAEQVMEGVERDKAEEQLENDVSMQDVKVVAQPDASAERSSAPQEDGENITVTPRNKIPLSIDTSRVQHPATDSITLPTPGEQDRMTTRTSSGALRKRSISELLGQTPSRREVMSPEVISPTTSRHMLETPAAAQSSATFQTPRRAVRSSIAQNSLSNAQSAIDDLDTLKGAADDPDRDYLEPLFRIQAHDSPNVRTTSLPDLVRTASKTLSTEDQFATLHERLDYRILRRIYQLQNANKWSLRQMEKCKEPDQPITHHDYMMAEMKWMRKDFKAERKMKKSVCAWLARRCADWVAASADERKAMQVQVQAPKVKDIEESGERTPDLEMAGESPLDDEMGPPTPPNGLVVPMNLIVPPELSDMVSDLQKTGQLSKALEEIPVAELTDLAIRIPLQPALTPVSKFVGGKVLPRSHGPARKRSRYDYEDEAETPADQRNAKRMRAEHDLPPEDDEIALFHPDNKAVRARLHQNNTFRPPSEFVMPATQFYEFRNGSQWLADDDKKLRDLAKEYSFNWSLIADELQLPGIFKSSAERRTPWECFERWVELEQLPTEMKKTMYFKTWFQRLEQSQQAAERRYQAQVAALQAASNGQASHVPMRRRTVPTRVDKRKNTRYLWLVDAMRKLARKKEQKAYKEAEAHRAAAGRRTQSDNSQPRAQIMTPLEFSKKRYEADVLLAEQNRQQTKRRLEAAQRAALANRQAQQQLMMQQQQQQGMQNGVPNPQRPGSASNVAVQQAQMQANGQPQANMNGQMAQQVRQGMPMATRNGHLAVAPVNAQGIPQAQMRPNGQMPNAQETMQRMAQANAQARNAQFPGQAQPYPMPSANMISPGSGGMSAQQLQQSNQAMLATMQQQLSAQQHAANQMSPHMPPPPAPQTSNPQQLSSGHVPALLGIKAQIRNKFPTYSEEQISQLATEVLKTQSQSQARVSAMNAAATMPNLHAYGHNATAFQTQQQQQQQLVNNGGATAGMSPASPQQYAALMRQRQMQQMQQSPSAAHANLNGSPNVGHASPGLPSGSPNLQYASMNPAMGMQGPQQQQQHPQSRSNTPQMPQQGGHSPSSAAGLQGSPRGLQAGLAR